MIGAKHFLLPSYPNITLAPVNTLAGPAFAAGTAAFVATFIPAVKALVQKLTAKGVYASYGDFYDTYNVIYKDPVLFGYKNVTSGCVFGYYGQPGYSLCSTDPMVQNTYLWW